jgi:succinyl-CoA:acetate CoA-transferase
MGWTSIPVHPDRIAAIVITDSPDSPSNAAAG